MDYIAKPVNDVILLSKVRIFLDLYNGRRTMRGLLQQLEQRNRQLEAEVAERKRLEELARHQAGHDALTGLPNRVLFRDRMEQAVAHASRRRESFALLYIDLDGFKPINDALGHVGGDQALRQIAVRLQEATRQSDTCARLGGDEFAVIMDGATAEAAGVLGEKLCEHLRRPLNLNLGGGDTRQVQAGASIGAAVFSGSHHDEAPDVEGLTERMIRVADQAMYEAKRAGRNRCVVAPQVVSGAADQSR